MANKRYVLICTQRGVFIGVDDHYAYFSKFNAAGAWQASSFTSEESARAFGVENLNHAYEYEYIVGEIETKDKHVHVVDMVKAGLGEHLGDMFMHMPNFHPVMQ